MSEFVKVFFKTKTSRVREVFQPGLDRAGQLAHHDVFVTEKHDGFTVDIERGVHVLAEREDLSCIEFSFMTKFLMVKKYLEELIPGSSEAKTVCLVKVVAYLIVATTEELFDRRIIVLVNLFSEPLGNLLRQGPLRFVLRRQV